MHPLDRPGQQPAYEKIIKSRKHWIFVKAPTGLGKTALAAQAVEDGYRVMALVQHKSLQVENYQNSYNFNALFGKANYQCNGADFRNAEECNITARAYQRSCQGICPYSVQREIILNSNAASINYAKFLADKRLVEEYSPDILFLDEAHNLDKTTLDYCGTTIKFTNKMLQYTDPILIKNNGVGLVIGNKWMTTLKTTLRSVRNKEPWMKRRITSLENTLRLTGKSKWFIQGTEEKFICKPLAARYHFSYLFNKANKIVAMSATISEEDIAALGIKDYEFIQVPNLWPPWVRPVYLLDAPRMRHGSSTAERREHLAVIKAAIESCPKEWSGIIHSPSKKLANEIYINLANDLDRPFFLPTAGQGTEQVAADWEIARRPGMIGFFWQLWEGADLGQDQINIIAKVPFINFANEYDKARFDFNRTAALQRVANQLMQGLGRIWRGRKEDYGKNSFVAIADGNWTRVKKFIYKDILASFREYNNEWIQKISRSHTSKRLKRNRKQEE